MRGDYICVIIAADMLLEQRLELAKRSRVQQLERGPDANLEHHSLDIYKYIIKYIYNKEICGCICVYACIYVKKS